MAEDYYEDGGGGESMSTDAPDARDPEDGDKTALIPESLCPGMDVGDTVELEIVGVREGEYEVRYGRGRQRERKRGRENDREDGDGSTAYAHRTPGQPDTPMSMGGYLED